MRIHMLLASIVLVLLFSSCGIENSSMHQEPEKNVIGEVEQEETMPDIRYDTDKLKEWFPHLEEIVSAEWETYPDGDNEYPAVPSRGSFAAKGYIILSEDKAREYLEAYHWNEAVPDVQMKYVSTDKLNTGKWLFSWQFDHDFRPQSFIGYFWFDGETVLFDVGK